MKLRLRPSDAYSWRHCRKRPWFVADLLAKGEIVESSSDFAVDGILAHEIVSHTLQGKAPPRPPKDEEMVEHCENYVKFVQSRLDPAKQQVLLIEQQVEVYYAPGRKGYVDAAVVNMDGSAIYVIDLKYGRGVSVQARDNEQLASYARSLVSDLSVLYDFTDDTLITIAIWQPRIMGEETVRLWCLTLGELDKFTEELGMVAEAIQADPENQPFAPSDKTCQFCVAEPKCKARAEQLLGCADASDIVDVAVVEPRMELANPETLSTEQLVRVLTYGPAIAKYVEKCEAHAVQMLLKNRDAVPGKKVVAGTKHRQWGDEAKAKKWLQNRGLKVVDICKEPQLHTPAQLEKVVKKLDISEELRASFNTLIVKPPGGPTLADADDKRPWWEDETKAENEFEQVGTDADVL